MRSKIIVYIAFLIALFASPGMAGTGTIVIYGTNVSNAQANVTSSNGNTVVVSQWGADTNTTRAFSVNVIAASDTLTFDLGTFYPNKLYQLSVNRKVVDAYMTNAIGNITFTRTQPTSNYTFSLQPASNIAGYNATFGWFWNLTAWGGVLNGVTINNPVGGINGTFINSGINASNITTGLLTQMSSDGTISQIQINNNSLLLASNGTGIYMGVNSYYTSPNWNRFNTSQVSDMFAFSPNVNGKIVRYRAKAGTNPITWNLLNTVVISDVGGTFAGLFNTDTGEKQANKNVANGYAGLDANGMISSNQIASASNRGQVITLSGNPEMVVAHGLGVIPSKIEIMSVSTGNILKYSVQITNGNASHATLWWEDVTGVTPVQIASTYATNSTNFTIPSAAQGEVVGEAMQWIAYR